nr:hypothetical protein Iba_chr15aCG17060 [Ipomoea batatas]
MLYQEQHHSHKSKGGLLLHEQLSAQKAACTTSSGLDPLHCLKLWAKDLIQNQCHLSKLHRISLAVYQPKRAAHRLTVYKV